MGKSWLVFSFHTLSSSFKSFVTENEKYEISSLNELVMNSNFQNREKTSQEVGTVLYGLHMCYTVRRKDICKCNFNNSV